MECGLELVLIGERARIFKHNFSENKEKFRNSRNNRSVIKIIHKYVHHTIDTYSGFQWATALEKADSLITDL